MVEVVEEAGGGEERGAVEEVEPEVEEEKGVVFLPGV